MKFKFIEAGKVMSNKDEIIRFLDIDGNLVDDRIKTSASNKDLLEMYKVMVTSRQWDLYALTLQKTGRLGTFAPNLGEEAFLSALGYALEKDDWFVPHYRILATAIARGVTLEQVYLYWRGSEYGSHFPGINMVPMQVIIASQISQGAGVAYAVKQQGKKNIVLTTIGNGGTNEGEFHEGLNLAAVRNLPLVVAISNNQWAISVPAKHSYKVDTLSQRASGYGIPGLRVDGNDLLASYEVAKEAYAWAREGHGPVLIEFVTWRQGQHTTSDDPRVYRSREEEERHERWEPMHRIEKYLIDRKILTEETKQKIWDDAMAEAKKAYETSTKALEKSNYDQIYDYTYAELPAELKEQKERNKRFLK